MAPKAVFALCHATSADWPALSTFSYAEHIEGRRERDFPPEAGPPSAEKLFMFTVYILESTQFGKLYTGLTDDLTNRLKKHNAGGVRSTKAYKPYKLVYGSMFYQISLNMKRAF